MTNFEQINQSNIEQVPFGIIHHDLASILPTASEIGHLWSSYLAENMSVCMLKFMVAKAKDADIKPILQQALDVSSQRIQAMENLFNVVHHPIPEGFGDNDVDSSAPELFRETFSLAYTRLMNISISLQYNIASYSCSRPDFVQFFVDAANTSRDINLKASNVLLAKGLLTKPPHINIPDRVEKVHDKDYMGSFFGGKRPLNALEVSHLYQHMVLEIMFATLKLGFSQVTKSKRIKDNLLKGSQVHQEQGKVLGSFLHEEGLPTPMPFHSLLTDSKQSPFSDKLMLFHSTVVTSFSLTANGFSLATSARKDVIAAFSRLSFEMLKYAKDSTEIMIENSWLERVPETVNRKELLQ